MDPAPPASHSIQALILAAGRGRRLGRTKALMDLGDGPALRHVLDVLRQAGLKQLAVVLGPDADAVRDAVDLHDVRVARNPEPERGMSASLAAGLLALGPSAEPHTALLLHTVDHPLVTAADVATLLEAWNTRRPGTQIVAPSVNRRRGHPTLFGPVARLELADLADDEPPHQVVRRDPDRVQHVELTDPWILRDVDTPEDLAAARAEWARRRERD